MDTRYGLALIYRGGAILERSVERSVEGIATSASCGENRAGIVRCA